jgi:hypothetical protein
MTLTKDEKAYVKAVIEREWKHLATEESVRERNSPLAFFVTQENYEQFVKALLKKLQ